MKQKPLTVFEKHMKTTGRGFGAGAVVGDDQFPARERLREHRLACVNY
jgi:hypothetical protein